MTTTPTETETETETEIVTETHKPLSHTQMVRKLIKPGDEILASLTPAKTHLIHMAFGFIGEWHELVTYSSRENYIEELGDMWFFLKGTALGVDVDHAEAIQVIQHEERSFTDELFKLHDLIKKYVIHSDEKTYLAIQEYTYLCITLFREKLLEASCSIEQIESCNQKKLTGPNGRYPSGVYSDQQATERADKSPS